MHAAARGQLGAPTTTLRSSGQTQYLDTTEPVEIHLLSEAKSHQAAHVLQKRARMSRPMARSRAVTKSLLQCQERTGASSPGSQKADERTAQVSESLKWFQRGSAAKAWLSQQILPCVPLLSWVQELSFKSARSDIIAGLTVGVMAIPQSMSYANIAGLPYIYGLYSACIPTFVYAIFGQSKQLAVGPVAMVSLLVSSGLEGQLSEAQCPDWYAAGGASSGLSQREVCEAEYVKLAILTAMLVGVLQIAAMILRLGFLVSFLGHPVTSGFTSGAAIIIGFSQLKYMFGLDIEKSEYIYVTVREYAVHITKTNWITFALGVASFLFLIAAKKASKKWSRLTFLAPMAPLLCCLVGTLLLWLCKPLRTEYEVAIVKEIPSGLMPWSLGAWTASDIPKVFPTALSATLIGYMESIAIGKNLAAKHGYDLEAGQELFALGLSNLVGAMFSCYPVTGSFSRSAVNNATGATSQLAGLITAVVMMCTLLFLTPLFYYLPKYVLGAIVISSVAPLVAYWEALKLWRVKRPDFFLWVAAFLGVLFLGVLQGMLLAVGFSLIIVIYQSARPQIAILWRIPGTTIYRNIKQESSGAFVPNVFITRIGSSMYFANASFVKDMLLAYVDDLEEVNPTEYIVLEMSSVVTVDSTALHILEDVVTDFRNRHIHVAFAMVGNRLSRNFEKGGLTTFVGGQWFFHTVHDAVVGCLRHQQAKRKQIRCRTIAPPDDVHVSGMENVSGPTGSDVDRDVEAPSFRTEIEPWDEDTLHVEENPVVTGTEIGYSNDLHHSCTVIFINMKEDVPMIMSEITAMFQRRLITVCRANIEAMGDCNSSVQLHLHRRAEHVYHVRSLDTLGKLTDSQLREVKLELEEIIHRHIDHIESSPPSSRLQL